MEGPGPRPKGDAGAHRARGKLRRDLAHRAGTRGPPDHDRARRGRARRQGGGGGRSGAQRVEGASRAPAGRGAVVRRGGCQRQLPRGPRRRGGNREPGLGPDVVAHVYALGRAASLQGRISRGDAGRGGGAEIRDRAHQGPQRLWLAQDRRRRAPAGAHFALRRQCAAAYLVRERERLSGGRRPHRGRHQGIRRAASTSTRPNPRSG